MADSQHITVRLQTRSEFFAKIAACACEKEARKLEGAGWRIEHGDLS
jgi:hypothetical protein